MTRGIRQDDDGVRWCCHRKTKLVCETLEEAWLVAFRTFITYGRIVTPYRCGRSRSGAGEVRWRVRTNPWAFAPWSYSLGSRRIRIVGCGKWHLSKSTCYVLPSTDRSPDREGLASLSSGGLNANKPSALQESDFLRNPAGLLVGPARQCHTATGKPKLCFSTEDECIHWISEHFNGRGLPYRCNFGHIHISNKSWTRPIIQKAPREM